jgi:GR25 family glycosyltransferase involved in LPS biosynthesis
MNTPLERFFDHILVINLARRTDRREQIEAVLVGAGVTNYEWFVGHDRPVNHEGRISGNLGCTASHRGVLELIAHHRWGKTLVLEDDALFLENFNGRFQAAIDEAPPKWDFLFLGGSYAETPKRRYNRNWIQTNGLMTTSSYGITCEMARKMAPHISGDVGIDSLYHQFQRDNLCYMMTPRLVVQRPSFSDIQERGCDNSMSMLDSRHEEMFIEGRWGETVGSLRSFKGEIMRREVAAQHDMDGEIVIVGDRQWKIAALQLPKHKAPWYRGELVTYILEPA